MEKDIALALVDRRISGLNATVEVAKQAAEEYSKFGGGYEPKPVNIVALDVELRRLEAARKNIKKRKN